MPKCWITSLVLASALAGSSAELSAQPVTSAQPVPSVPPSPSGKPSSPAQASSSGQRVPMPSSAPLTAPSPPSTPPLLTLDAALRAVVVSAALDGRSADVVAALGARAAFAPVLQSDVGLAPDVGAPAKYAVSEQVSFDIGAGARRLGRARTIQAAAAQALASFASSRRSAVQAVLAAFFAVAGDQAQVASSSQNVLLGQRTLDAARQRHRIGLGPRVDEDRAYAALGSSEADLAAANAALAADRDALGGLLSEPLGAAVALPAAREIPTPNVVRDRVLQQSPLVASAAAELQSAQAALLIARAESSPGIALGAGAGLTGDGTGHTVGPVVSATLTLPIAPNVVRAERGAASAQVAAATAALEQARRDAVANALRLRSQAIAAAARIAPLREAVTSADRVVESTLGGYRLGAVGSNELIDAQTQFIAARTALDAAVLQTALALTTLQLETGDLPS